MPTIQELRAEATVPVIIVDHEGVILHINTAFAETFGWQNETLIGQTLTTIIPGTLKDAHHMGFSRFLVTGNPMILDQALKLMILNADGTEEAAEHFIVAEKTDDGWVFGASIKPLGQS